MFNYNYTSVCVFVHVCALVLHNIDDINCRDIEMTSVLDGNTEILSTDACIAIITVDIPCNSTSIT